jgi:hypothetical protein
MQERATESPRLLPMKVWVRRGEQLSGVVVLIRIQEHASQGWAVAAI